MVKRKIIKIDENKCNGCGLCIPNCREGAIQIIDQKARLVSDLFCDGLGACLGHCPQGAISIEEREAAAYDERLVMQNRKLSLPKLKSGSGHQTTGFSACPGSKMVDFRKKELPALNNEKSPGSAQTELRQWPVQLTLVPATAPYLNHADLLIAADCVPFAYADFHQDLLKGKTLLVACPKLDNMQMAEEKINRILESNSIKSITYAHMEVPCCFGLVPIIKEAISRTGKDIPFKEVTLSIAGERLAC